MKNMKHIYRVTTRWFEGPSYHEVEGFYTTMKDIRSTLKACGFKHNKKSGDWYRGPNIHNADHHAYIEVINNGCMSCKKAKQEEIAYIALVLYGKYERQL